MQESAHSVGSTRPANGGTRFLPTLLALLLDHGYDVRFSPVAVGAHELKGLEHCIMIRLSCFREGKLHTLQHCIALDMLKEGEDNAVFVLEYLDQEFTAYLRGKGRAV